MSRSHPPPKSSQYRLLGLVGQGQFGQVFCAIHRQTGRLVALKKLDRQRFPTYQFLRELRFLLSLQHPNIVTCYAIEHTHTGRYLVMDYCEGGTLRGVMSDEKRLRLEQSLRLISDVLYGLEHAHGRGIVHCDIKPENILLQMRVRGWTAKISDFGIARLSQELSTLGTGNTGSPAYMAPERFYGQYSSTSDLYSTGVMLFELLAGYRPFSGAPGALMDAHLNRPVVFPETVPQVLRPVIQKSLQKLSARRFHDAREMQAALHDAALSLNIDLRREGILSDVPLLDSLVVPLDCPFQAERRDPLKTPAHYLGGATCRVTHTVAGNDGGETLPKTVVYYAGQTHAAFQIETQSASVDSPEKSLQEISQETCNGTHANKVSHSWKSITLPEPIQDIRLCPQGCVLQTSHRTYFLSYTQLTSLSTEPLMLQQYEHDCVTTVEADGQWMAVVTDMRRVVPKHGFSCLSFHTLPDQSKTNLTEQPIRLSHTEKAKSLLRAIALDAGHVAVFSDIPLSRQVSPSELTTTTLHSFDRGTQIEVVNRRGKRLGAITLPMLLDQIVATTTPYRFWATDEYDLYSILQIDLKPVRVSRIPVQIVPKFLAIAQWGAVVMNEQGHLILLDQSGCPVNRLKGPPHPTTIALYDPCGLLISTWENNRGYLYTADLKSLGADILF